MWRQVSFIGLDAGGPGVGGVSLGCETSSSWGLWQRLEADRNVPRSPNRSLLLSSSSSSRNGDSSDLVSERTPESSLAELELLSPLLSPLLSEWKSADDSELGVTSGKERLLLRLLPPPLVATSPGPNKAVTSDPGERVRLARLRFREGGGGSILGMVCLHLWRGKERNWLVLGCFLSSVHKIEC